MKKVLEIVGELKSWISLTFTASLLIYLTVDFLQICWQPIPESEKFWGNNTWWDVFMDRRIQIGLVVQLFFLCACISVLQYVFFSGKVLKKPSYSLRMAVFGVLCFGLCVGFAVFNQWFQLDDLGHWATFVIIFLISFGGISLGFELYYRILGAKYDERLGRVQSKKNAESKEA